LLALGLAIQISQTMPAGAQNPVSTCRAPGTLVAFDSPLKGLARAVQAGREIRIVALGSSSTEGTGASTKQAAYPARFDQEMDRRFPGKDFQVANLGKGGELVEAMLARLMRDVIPARPTLVLWQTGVNDAIGGADIPAFRKALISGITALKAAGIEVVLVDPQYYPRSAGVARYEDFVAVMRAVAREQGVPVFRRYAIMKHLIASGQQSADAFLWKDKFHLNDTSYACLAELMAEAVEFEIRRPAAPVISAGVTTAGPLSGWSPVTAY
jgi:lysophospholipase L1-like esterase